MSLSKKINIKDLKKYAESGLNVILTGRHGVGKTAIIKEVFTEVFGEQQKNWLTYSASSMDPWVDFIGIPKNYTNEKGQEVFRIIPPDHFTGEENIQAMFFDEINRGEAKTLNAIMELIQFKSINGRKFPNLKCIWAAENPPGTDDEYSVMPLDPAQKDRFQIQLNIPYELDDGYFISKYGKQSFDIMKEWWRATNNKPSPRKMDDVLDGARKGFNIMHYSNIHDFSELAFSLKNSNIIPEMIKIIDSGIEDEMKEFFTFDKIREAEKLLEKSKEKGKILDAIYNFVDGETKEYLKKAFSYDFSSRIKVNATDAFTAYQLSNINKVKNISLNQKRDKCGTTVKNVHNIMNSITETILIFEENNLKCVPNFSLDPKIVNNIFCIEFMPSDMSTNFNRTFANTVLSDKSNLETFKDFIRFVLLVLAKTKNAKSTNLMSIFTRFVGSKDIINVAGLDKNMINSIKGEIWNSKENSSFIGEDIIENINKTVK